MCGMKRKRVLATVSYERWLMALNRIMAYIRGYLIRLRTNAILEQTRPY